MTINRSQKYLVIKPFCGFDTEDRESQLQKLHFVVLYVLCLNLILYPRPLQWYLTRLQTYQRKTKQICRCFHLLKF